jgi:hypothetical protein
MKKIVLAFLVFTSCAPVYVPNSRNSPMFRKAGEFQASGSFGNGVEAQSALSVTNHLGVMANFLYLDRDATDNSNNTSSTTTNYRHHKFFEGGVGYFENQEKMFVEIFAGYGRGEGSSSDDFIVSGNTVQATGKYERYFIQPAFGFNRRTMNVSFVPRFTMVDFTEFTDGNIKYSINEDPVFFFEPAVIGRVNFANDRVFFLFQAGFSASFDSGRYFDHRPFHMTAGLGFRLGRLLPGSLTKTE